ncbi:MAG: hypothetical protein ACLFV7_14795 [Phycisphaerae bacterium]
MSRTRRKLLTGLGIAVVLWTTAAGLRLAFSRYDYDRVRQGQRPVFATEVWSMGDGGTVGYRGLGYDIEARHRMHARDGKLVGHHVGPILICWGNWLLGPLEDRSDVRFVPLSGP